MPEKEQGEIQESAYDRLYYFCVRYLDRFVFAQPGIRDPLQPVDRLLGREIVGIAGLGGFLGMLLLLQSEQMQTSLGEVAQSFNIPTEQMLNTNTLEESVQHLTTFGAVVYAAIFLDRFPDVVRALQRFSQSVADSPWLKHSSPPEIKDATLPPEENL